MPDVKHDSAWSLVGFIDGDFEEVHVDCIGSVLPPIEPCLADPRCGRIRAWHFDHWRTRESFDEDYRPWLQALAARGPFESVRGVSIDSAGGMSGDTGLRCKLGELELVADAFPRVVDLALRGVWTLGRPLHLPHLRDLYVDAARIDAASATALLGSAMPGVTCVRARFCEDGSAQVPQEALLALVQRDDLPDLRELELAGATLRGDFLVEAARGALLPTLGALRVERCAVDEPAAPLGELAARFGHLDELVLPEDLWSLELERELPAADFRG